MLRLVLAGLLAAAIIYIGIGIKRYYRVRATLLNDITLFIERMQQEIGFLKPPIAKIVEGFCGGKKTEFARIIAVGLASSGSGKFISSPYMTEYERETFTAMMTSVTSQDCKTLLHNLEGYKQRFNAISIIAKDKSNKIGQLSFKLSVMIAVLAMILVA